MTTATTVKGQVTIPKRVHDALPLSPGGRVKFDVNCNEQVVVPEVFRTGVLKAGLAP